jgi:hypothetical protein
MLNVLICELRHFTVLFSVSVPLSGECLFSCIRHKLKYFSKIGCIRKAMPLVKIFNVDVGEHGNLGISLV